MNNIQKALDALAYLIVFLGVAFIIYGIYWVYLQSPMSIDGLGGFALFGFAFVRVIDKHYNP